MPSLDIVRSDLIGIKAALHDAIQAQNWADVRQAKEDIGAVIDSLDAAPTPAPPPPPPPVPPQPKPPQKPDPKPATSGSWLSGVGASSPVGDDYQGAVAWAQKLGVAKVDIVTSFMVHDTKAGVLSRIAAKAPALRKLADAGIKLCQTVPIITQEDVGSRGFIGRQEHRDYLLAFGRVLLNAGHKDARLRLGHEMNGGHYPWAQLTPSQYIDAFRFADSVFRNVLVDFRAIFNPLRGGSVLAWYPGDTSVDLVGADWYNNGGVPGVDYVSDKASWDKAYMAGTLDDPKGWGQWLAFAHAHGKKLCVPEWGFGHGSQQSDSPEQDTPGFVPVFKAWLAANSADIDFETYFNDAQHGLLPLANQGIAKSAAAYFSTWAK